ncbi:MAG: DUF4261 domain-containing protein [Ruminococcaceae bacterium]|nr:DUF4261 domain-containing protein [Oscillospiraceae bacterium]
MSEKEEFQQDLSKEENPGGVFVVKLLFKKEPAFPSKEKVAKVMEEYLGDIDHFWYDEKGTGIAAKDYICEFKDGKIPATFMLAPAVEFDENQFDAFIRSQMWDCPDKDKILSECKYQIIATDMYTSVLPALVRANLDMDFAEAVMELFPDCEAILFFNSLKLFPAKDFREHKIPRNDRYIKFAMNVRFFTIQGTKNDMIVDTLGMGLLFLPDLQYHFHDFDPNLIVNHAYCIESYILSNNNPIQNGDTVDSVKPDGQFDQVNMWKCNYENALIQPVREVIDVNMEEYAAGQR